MITKSAEISATKTYYRIREVVKMIGIPASTLRF